jgi:SAM-dependent methyltransferase
VSRSFEELVAEAESAPIEGWDFSWLEGRATEDRPSWGYSRLLAQRASRVSSMLDLQTGGGELLSELRSLPPLTVATEGWGPNVGAAARRLRGRAWVVAAVDDAPELPFGSGTFELVASRHPVTTWWQEIARVLEPGGEFFSQQVGPRSMGELTEFFMGPQRGPSGREPELARDDAEAAGLVVADLRSETKRATFSDVGAVVYFLRLVVWIVPGFTVGSYMDRLEEMHNLIRRDGPFVAHSSRFLIRATKPAR